MADIAHLSSPDLGGRLTGTRDDLQSARFVSERFTVLGLKPFSTYPNGLMTTEVIATHIAATPAPVIRLESKERASVFRIGHDYLPILDSPSIDVTAPLVFVGYGISDPVHQWDEYADVDVRDRIVVFLRGKPDGYPYPIAQADKVRTARQKGAAAFLTFTGPLLSPYEARRGMGPLPLALYNQTGPDSSLAGAWIHTDLATQLFSERSLVEIQQRLQAKNPQSFQTDMQLHLAWLTTQENGLLHNVMGLLPGADPSLANEIVVIGAHRDHFGKQGGLWFPGADDNASGTAVLLEIARALAGSDTKRKRSIVFVSFSGEEQGLLGSRYYVQQTLSMKSNVVAMINMDHAGIGNGRLTVGVTGLDRSMATRAGERAGIKDLLDVYGFFPGGDHVPFHEVGIPTITVVSGGIHPHYHQPTDSLETLSAEILERTATYILSLVEQLTSEH